MSSNITKNKKSLISLVVSVLLMLSCQEKKLNLVFEMSGENQHELKQVLRHYKESGDILKYKAAEFLISNMLFDNFFYDGDIIQRYDTIFKIFKSLRQEGVYDSDPPELMTEWKRIEQTYGAIKLSNLIKKYDNQSVSADFLIHNIDIAFEAWRNSPFYNPSRFDDFCEYILPYRVSNESIERYRDRYYDDYRLLIDTARSINEVVYGFHLELRWNRKYRSSGLMWDYPLDLSVSKMEIARRGACRHNTTFQTLVMRACGLPVAIDRAIWANRSTGHSWNVVMLDDGRIFPFDALSRDSIKFSYKPAKIFRSQYSFCLKKFEELKSSDMPQGLMRANEVDVTGEYCKTVDVEIPVFYKQDFLKYKKKGVICTFDNRNWRVVYYGPIKDGKMHFTNMAVGNVYLAAFYDNGEIFPASEPFLIKDDGTNEVCKPNYKSLIDMRLNRKYPRFKRIEDHAWGVRRSNAEGSDYQDFRDSTVFFSVYDIPFQIADSIVKPSRKHRFFRFNSSVTRNANYAEVEFYGKKSLTYEEVKLEGRIIGFPPSDQNTKNSYWHAMDGDLETWFEKPKNEVGWVGLDLGSGNEHYLTRVRFCPRSDTNFILVGDRYELFFWDKMWKSVGEQIATDSILNFMHVPGETIYLLRNHTRGKEERIFTYENNRQVWW